MRLLMYLHLQQLGLKMTRKMMMASGSTITKPARIRWLLLERKWTRNTRATTGVTPATSLLHLKSITILRMKRSLENVSRSYTRTTKRTRIIANTKRRMRTTDPTMMTRMTPTSSKRRKRRGCGMSSEKKTSRKKMNRHQPPQTDLSWTTMQACPRLSRMRRQNS